MKFVTSTYLKGITNYNLRLHIDKSSNLAVCVKKIKKINEPFVLNEDGVMIKILDTGYYIVEFVPFDKNYICRVHLDEKGELIEQFFTATKNNAIQEGIPCFDDLKLSYVCSKASKKIYNIEGLENLLQTKQITKEDFDEAQKTINLVKKEVEEKWKSL